MDNILLRFILQQAECSPENVKFSEKQLTDISQELFDTLKKQGYIRYHQYDPAECFIIDKQGNERFIRKIKGKWLAISTEDSEIPPITLTSKDVTYYAFNINPLLKDIKTQNDLSGSINELSPRTYFIGTKMFLDKKVNIMLCLFDNDGRAETELQGINLRVTKCDVFLILCPSYRIKNQSFLKRIQDQSIFPECFDDVFKGNDFMIDNRIFQKMYLPKLETKNKKILVKFPTPPGTKWEDVTIQITSKDSIKINVNGFNKPYTYTFAEIGFIDKRKGDLPDNQWNTLLSLARAKGEISWKSGYANLNIQKRIQAIRKTLKNLMGLNDDPFYPYKENQSYKTKFNIEDVFFTQDDFENKEV